MKREKTLRFALGAASMLSVSAGAIYPATAGAQAAATAAARQVGTVKAIAGSSITLAADAGPQVEVTVKEGARIVQVSPGSTDLKAAQTITLADIAAGDRISVTGTAGDTATAFTASRVILMKSTDIAQKNATEQEEWTKRGAGGRVTAIDSSTGTLTVASGPKNTQVTTSRKTIFKRYAGDSVRFQDAKLGSLAQIQVGDQLLARGAKDEDGASIQAAEVVSGSFRNLAGTVASVDAGAGTLTLKDLATKKTLTVSVTANSDLRKLPAQAATMFAAQQKAAVAGRSGSAGASPRPGEPGATSAGKGAGIGQGNGSGAATGTGAGAMRGPGSGGRAGGMDLSQMLTRLPTGTLADLHAGDAVMIVASQSQPGSDSLTAVTLLSGVEAILAATPTGQPAMTLSPWNIGGPEVPGGGGQ